MAAVRLFLGSIGARPQRAGLVAVTVDWYRARRLGDLDNRIKVVLDAIQGWLYWHDGQVARILASRYEDPERPRVELVVEPAPELEVPARKRKSTGRPRGRPRKAEPVASDPSPIVEPRAD